MTQRTILDEYKSTLDDTDDVEACRFFIGQDIELSVPQMETMAISDGFRVLKLGFG